MTVYGRCRSRVAHAATTPTRAGSVEFAAGRGVVLRTNPPALVADTVESTLNSPVFSIRELVVEFATRAGTLRAVRGVSLDVFGGETVGIVGESGSGKTVTMMSSLRLIPQPPARIVSGEALFRGKDILQLPPNQLRAIRGNEIGVIFQDPATYLNPVLRVGDGSPKSFTFTISHWAIEMQSSARSIYSGVWAPSAEARVRQYPHEFSGGMRQRVLIAIAIANDPALLVADEPTTALDVTVQADILDAIRRAQEEAGAASVLVTHDLGVIAELADRVFVMYAGRVVESASVDRVFNDPRHPYTAALLRSVPRASQPGARLTPIAGAPPSMRAVPPGCSFHPRCPLARGRSICVEEIPPLLDAGDGHASACHFSGEMSATPPALRGVAS